jgi:hypothetical protein
VVDTVVVDDIDYIANRVVLEDHKLAVVVVVVVADNEYLNLLHIPMVHIFRNILPVKQLLQNPFHNWVYYKYDDHNWDLHQKQKTVNELHILEKSYH